jgi:N-acetylglucosaminyldiphosphoundecaprenol N-acetyl-beta-D-mannosaminyltransferase
LKILPIFSRGNKKFYQNDLILPLKWSELKKMTPKKDGNIVKIVQTNLNSSPMDEVLGLIEGRISQNKKTFIVTPNPEFLVYGEQNPWFEEVLIHSDIAISDGVALLWVREVIKEKGFLKRLLKGFLTGLKVIFAGWGKRRVTGIDLMAKLCQLVAKKRWSVYLLGGKPRIAQKTLGVLRQKYPDLQGWAENGPNLDLKNWDKEMVGEWIKKINQKAPDLLFVAFGMGKQEKFISDNWADLKVKLAMGIGGAFNYLSGEVKRPPQWIQNMGFEWLYRLMKEPWRWKRQLSLGKFIWLVLTSK